MKTKLEEIAEKAHQEPELRFTSLAHHITQELIQESLRHMNVHTSPGVDNTTVKEAKETCLEWMPPMLQQIHHKGYKPPEVKRCWIPKLGKQEKRPIGIPTVADRSLQRSVVCVLSAIYEQDFKDCSFGGRPGRSAHQALATLNEIISGKKVSWVYEADLKNYFGSLSHEWLIKFVEHRIGDPRIISLIRRWLKAGIMENGKVTLPEEGTPQGGSISVLLSNIYLHYVLDLWFEKAVKPNIKGAAFLIRYIDDFVVCFQYREDALRFQNTLVKRLRKFSLTLEPNKTRLIEFGRFAQKSAKAREKKVETVYFLGFTHFCTRNRKGNFMVGRKTEKSRFKRSACKIKELLRTLMHSPPKVQVMSINQYLRGHYAYYGLGGNLYALQRIHQFVEKRWKKMLGQRSWKGRMTWDKYQKIKERYPILKPKLKVPYAKMGALAIL